MHAKNENVTSKGLSLALNGSLGSAKNLLNRLYKQQLVNRSTTSETFKKSYYRYSITPKGIGRLEYLEKKEKENDKRI